MAFKGLITLVNRSLRKRWTYTRQFSEFEIQNSQFVLFGQFLRGKDGDVDN